MHIRGYLQILSRGYLKIHVGVIYRYIVGDIYRYILRYIYGYMVGYLQIQSIAESRYLYQCLFNIAKDYFNSFFSPIRTSFFIFCVIYKIMFFGWYHCKTAFVFTKFQPSNNFKPTNFLILQEIQNNTQSHWKNLNFCNLVSEILHKCPMFLTLNCICFNSS